MRRRGRRCVTVDIPGEPGATIRGQWLGEPTAQDIEALRGIGRAIAERMEHDPDARAPMPSQVVLKIPLLEGMVLDPHAEQAAGLIVRACQRLGNRWQPVGPDELDTMLEADSRGGLWPIATLSRTKRLAPSFDKLVDRGFARFLGTEGDAPWPVELTAAGLAALWAYVPLRGAR